MAAGRKKLSGLLHAAAPAAQQGRTLHSPAFSGTRHAPSPAQRSFFCSWLEHNVAGANAPSNSPPSCDRGTLLDHYGCAQPLTAALGLLTSSSLRSPLAPSLLPLAASSVYCPHFNLPSLCQILYINDVKTSKQTDGDDHLSPESPCKNIGKSAHESCHTHLHENSLKKEENSVKYQSPWSSNEVINWANAISFGRLLSGPLLAWLIVEGLLQPAVVGLVIAGASDWLDGYIARGKGIDSVFGTYLDPLADKVLIGCVALSMAHAGYLPSALVALVIGRDAALVAGSFIHRAHSMKWQVSSMKDFFNVMEGGAQKVKPLFISKINTVFQLALVGVALLQPAFGFEDTYSLVPSLSWCVAFTTCASSVGYGWKLFSRGH